MLFLGPAFDTALHRHHAAQLCLGLRGALRMSDTADGGWRQATAFYVPPDVPHAFDAAGSPCALLYLDPEGGECELACRRFGHDALRPLPEDGLPREPLRQLATSGGELHDAEAACHALLGSVEPPARRPLEPRLARVLDWLHAQLDEDVSLAAAARAAAVSESWLSHHFGEAIGVPLRRYVLWRRLRLAMEAALQGATLTEAAHAAGFADSAHLTRSFRDMFGVAPSFLFAQRERLDVRIADVA